MSQHNRDIIEREEQLFEQYLESLKPSKFDKISGGIAGVGFLIDGLFGSGRTQRNAASGFDNFISGQTRSREGRAQQGFTNQLRLATAGREEQRLSNENRRLGFEGDRIQNEQDRIELQRIRDENAIIGKTTPNPDFVSDLDKSLIDQRNASAELSRGRLENLGKDNGQQKIPLGSFIQNFLGGRQQIVPGTEGSLFPQVAPAPITPATVDSLGAYIQQLQGFGRSQVFPDTPNINPNDFLPARDLDLAETEGLARQWAEQNLDGWAEASEESRRQAIDKLIKEGIPNANR